MSEQLSLLSAQASLKPLKQKKVHTLTPAQRAWLRELPLEGAVKNRVRVAMALTNLSVTRLARTVGMVPTNLSAVLTGYNRKVSLQAARKIADGLGLTVEELFF